MIAFAPLRNTAAALAILAGTAALSSPAQATVILTFGQSVQGNTVVATENTSTSNGVTTISATNTPITISQIDAALPSNTPAFLNLSLTSIGAASAVGGFIIQDYSGSFSITSLLGGSGTNYLSGSLVDVAFGQGVAFTLSASTPPAGNVTFTSSVIADLNLDRGASFSFANVTPAMSIINNSIAPFTSSVSGTFSGTPFAVPEPASLALLGLGLCAVGTVRRLRGTNTIA